MRFVRAARAVLNEEGVQPEVALSLWQTRKAAPADGPARRAPEFFRWRAACKIGAKRCSRRQRPLERVRHGVERTPISGGTSMSAEGRPLCLPLDGLGAQRPNKSRLAGLNFHHLDGRNDISAGGLGLKRQSGAHEDPARLFYFERSTRQKQRACFSK